MATRKKKLDIPWNKLSVWIIQTRYLVGEEEKEDWDEVLLASDQKTAKSIAYALLTEFYEDLIENGWEDKRAGSGNLLGYRQLKRYLGADGQGFFEVRVTTHSVYSFQLGK